MASVKAGLRAARDALKAGDNEEAARRCEEVLRLDPTSYDALTYQGKAEFLLGQYGKSEGAYVRATKLNPSQLAAWQGLAEVYDQSGAHEQAVPVFKKLVELVPAGDGDGKRRVSFQKRLAAALQKSGCEEEAQQILLALLDAGLEPDAHIEILCLLADLQMMKDEQDLDKRIAERLQSPECMSGAIVCTREAVRIRVVGEWAEEALRQVDNPLNSTLKEIVARTAPNPEYIKYHIAYLLRFTKAIDFAEPRSIQRYNVRLQALERCYKLILGKGGGVPGGCCSPIPYETALRLLEISEEILGGQVAIGGQDFGKSFRRPSGPMGMFKSASHDQLSSLQGRFEGPRQLRRSSSLSSDDGQRPRYRIKLTSGIPKFNTAEHSRPSAAGSDHASSPALEIPSLSTSSPHKHGATDGLHPHALSSIDERTASKVGVNDPMPLSPVSRTPHAFAARKSEKDIGNYVLPQYMRSNSLQMVRKLHRLGSGILNGAEDVIGGNTPLLVEVSEKVACRFAHSFPWNSEAMLQMVLAWRRKTAASSPEEDTFSRARTTNLSELPIAHISPPSQSLKELIKVLQYGILSGSRSAAARIALMQVLLEEEQFQDAADLGQQSTKWMAQRLQDGGFPMVQAGLALQLLTGQALLKCREYDKAGAIFVGLVNGVSEGEVSFGVMAGAPPLSIRQQAQRGLAHIALAQGDRMLARQRYEEVLGASIMGKAPVEHWAAAEYGWMLFEEGDTVRAKMNLEKAVEIATKTDSTGLAAAIAEYNHKLGQIYWSLGKKWKNDRKFAYSRLLAAARVKGSHQADAFALLGHYYYEVAEDTTRARKCYQKAVSLDASQINDNLQKLGNLLEQGRLGGAPGRMIDVDDGEFEIALRR